MVPALFFSADNPLLRLLRLEDLAERLFLLLPAISVLYLERLNKDTMRIFCGRRVERIWMLLLRRDFGSKFVKSIFLSITIL